MAFNARIGKAVLELSIDGGAFVRGAGDAKATMRDLSRGIAQVQRDIGKQAFTFSGRDKAAEASRMAAAVQQVGGATKLVASDQAKVNAVLNQAIEHYRVLGKEAPQAWIDIERATRRAEQAHASYQTHVAQGLAKAQQGIQSQASLFGGRAQLADATMLVQALHQIGGAERLTASEKARVNAQLQETIEKYRVLGKDAPQALIATERATRGAGTATQWMHGRMVALGSFVGTFAANIATRAVSALVSMGREAFTSAGEIVDLANKTGVSTRTLQQMQFVAKQTGGSLEAFTGASFQLGIQLQSTNKEVRAALEELRKYGVDVARLKAARPDEQWNTVTKALGMVTSAQERNRIGLALMGKGYKDLASAASEGYQQIAAQAKISTDSQLKELDRLNDEFEKWKSNLSAGFGAAMGQIALETRIRSEVVDEYFRRRKEEPGFKGFPADESDEIRSAADYKPRYLNVEEEAQRRLQLRLYDAKAKDVQLTKAQAQAQDFYRSRLKAVNEELRNLKPAQRAELDAALKLGGDSLEDLEEKFNLTSGALRIYQAGIKDATRDTNRFNELLQKFNAGPAAKKEALELVEAMTPDPKTGKAILDLSRMAEEDQRKVGQALLEGVRAWVVAKEAVPKSVAAQLAAVLQLRMMPDLVKEIAEDTKLGLGAFAAQGLDQLGAEDAVNEQSAQNVATRIEARKNAARTVRDIELSAAEFGIEQAKRWGANWQDVYRAEAQLSRQRLDARIADSDQEFDERIREMKKSSAIEDATMAALVRDHQANVAQMVQDWRQGEIAKRDELQRTYDVWYQLRQRIKSELLDLRHTITGNLFSTLFAGGDDSAKKAAKAAREDYERIAKSGKASAEEITRAYRTMRQAEEAANSQWADRFKSMWDGIKRHLFNIFDQILEQFVNGLLKGMLRSFLGTSLGQKLGGWLTGLIPGLSGAGFLGGGGGAALASTSAVPSTASLLGAAPVASTATATATTTTAAASTAAGSGTAAAAASPYLGVGAAAGTVAPFAVGVYLLAKYDKINPELARYIRERLANRANDPDFDWRKVPAEFNAWKRKRPDQYRAWLADPSMQAPATFHTGGIVGGSTDRSTFDAKAVLKPGEVIIKALKGEGVLTPKATSAIGGASAISALNAGRAMVGFGGDIATFKSAIVDIVAREQARRAQSAEILAAMRNRPAGQSPFKAAADAIDRSMSRVSTLNAGVVAGGRGFDARAELQVPQPAPVGVGGGRPSITHNVFRIEARAIDSAGLDDLFDKQIIPRFKRELSFDRTGIVPAVKRAALK